MKYTIRDIVEIGIFVGIALVLNISIFTFHIMPNAGSISFSVLPLFIIALRKRWWKTFIACGIIYGLSACLIDGYGIQTYPLDYLLAYGGIIIISFFRPLILKKGISSYLFLILSCTLATIWRIMSSTISGMLIYEYTFISSLSYNSIYISITGAINIAILLILLKPLKIINEKYENSDSIKNDNR